MAVLDELTPNADTVEVLVDSGSGVHVCPSNLGADYYPVDDTVEKLKMYDVQSRPIPHGGQRTIDMYLLDNDADPQRARVAFELAPVARPILSVGRLVDRGASIHFTPEGSWMEQGDRVLNFQRRGNTYVVPANVCMPKPDKETFVAPAELVMARRLCRLRDTCHFPAFGPGVAQQ